jgi:hypothetical protein
MREIEALEREAEKQRATEGPDGEGDTHSPKHTPRNAALGPAVALGESDDDDDDYDEEDGDEEEEGETERERPTRLTNHTCELHGLIVNQCGGGGGGDGYILIHSMCWLFTHSIVCVCVRAVWIEFCTKLRVNRIEWRTGGGRASLQPLHPH